MAYLARSKKEDLVVLAEELGLTVKQELKVKQLHKLITESPSYDEEFTRELLDSIKEEREKKKNNVKKKRGRQKNNVKTKRGRKKNNVKKKRERKKKNVNESEPELLNNRNLNWKSELQAHSPLNLGIYLINLLKSECTM
ncbi:hypothetical protein AVEN_129446-1 [Araneus ventricosus]|uniref:Uncharacterized protein n=1 Tax=Araneus ventricosus TaxID=182803 RepID=A0A4Y2LW93_ARAVE|nr:hypothetical protein AVEN_129446-1 [Araneus ventricosus]